MATITERYSYNGYAGCVTMAATGLGTQAGLYVAAQAGLDPAGGPWVTVCEDHGTICNHASRKLAERHLDGTEWCEACEAIRAAHKANRKPAGQVLAATVATALYEAAEVIEDRCLIGHVTLVEAVNITAPLMACAYGIDPQGDKAVAALGLALQVARREQAKRDAERDAERTLSSLRALGH